MWFIIYSALIQSILAAEPAAVAPSLPAPVTTARSDSSAESNEIWNYSIERFAQRKYIDAADGFKRLIENYPSDAHALDAQFYLGQCHFRLGNYSDAIPPLRVFVETAGLKPERKEARIFLARSYLGAEKYSEALLAIQDFGRTFSDATESTSDRGRVLLYTAQAQIGLRQNLEAEKNLTAFFSLAQDFPDLGEEISEGALVRLRLKSNECERFPSSKGLLEDQILDQMKRKSLCTIEIVSHLNTIGKNPDLKSLDIGFSILEKNISGLRENILNPPFVKSKKSTVQWNRAKTELSTKLKTEWAGTMELITSILKARDGFQPRIERLNLTLNPNPPAPALPAATVEEKKAEEGIKK